MNRWVSVWGCWTTLLLLVCCNRLSQKHELVELPYGISYAIFPQKNHSDEAIKRGDIVKVRRSIHVGDSLTFDMNVGYPDYQLIRSPIQREETKDYLSQIFLYAHKGDSIVITQSIDSLRQYAYINTKKKGNVVIKLNILDVFHEGTQAEADRAKERKSYIEKEKKLLQRWLEERQITYVEKEGIFITPEEIEDTVPMISCHNCTVYLRYEGRTLNGKLIDETFSHQNPMKVRPDSMQFIEGFERAIRYAPEGKTIKAYIPSMLAYKETGSNTARVGPFEPIMFIIKVTRRTSQ